MKAWIADQYGPPDALRWGDAPVPEPGPDEVRVWVQAVSINPYDWHIYRADPWIVRPSFGWRSPGGLVVGADVTGVVNAVGANVSGVSVGDRIAGMVRAGALAEQAVVRADAAAQVPVSLTAAQAAALPMTSLTALHGLEGARLQEGASVLVIGASGGVGHMAVQIARALGAARVVAVASGARQPMLEGLGADRVIDYRTASVRDCGEKFDVIYDTVATESLLRLRHLLNDDGVYAPAGAVGGGKLLGPAWAMARTQLQKPLAHVRTAPVSARLRGCGPDLARVMAWTEDGTLTPVIERVYPWGDAREAFTRLEEGHVGGKLVLSVSPT
ncbi:NAD(P)-dependent alcohol dehydrogenase [Demequina sp. B12]|uniref:NAD(P)-dependent alcohol dehydrogenase n=1 Tax=Demequina sp. B12 TaxID=2992757 RepID=UPI00237ADA75|nr:NAD(P)-dependent alcohol dehydrogenase [Demequina sp. B12]MDE0572200.1 NAD(P)-dependent alcohol dehydrogenase [Demequina sp. B12]